MLKYSSRWQNKSAGRWSTVRNNVIEQWRCEIRDRDSAFEAVFGEQTEHY